MGILEAFLATGLEKSKEKCEEVMNSNGGHKISKQAEEWGRLSGEQDVCMIREEN